MATIEETPEEKKTREEAQARRQRILDGAGSRMDVVEGVVPKPEGTTSSSSSKLAAMRRRRFKKKTEASTETVKEETVSSEPAPVQEPTTSAEDAPTTNKQDDEDGTTKKKYMGVAKMRRLKLKEKQQQAKDTTEEATTVVPKQRKTTPRLPIIMHIFTVLLLFLAGLDIGLQQTKNSILDVHTDLAPRQLGGISFLISQISSETLFVRGGDMKAQLLSEPIVVTSDDADEFEVTGSDEKETTIIDPMFGVDLDKLTSGPGPMLWAARQAVKFHRLLLRTFYYGPIQFSQWLLSCTTNPPIFAVLAIILRQLVGNVILGAKLPDTKEDEEQQKDVMSMVKSFVTKFVLSAFPTAVSLYDGWVHLRADMYVVLCGFFIGLAVSHTPMIQNGTLIKQAAGSSDEL